jgi:gamma-resorcylate decarboxylase
MQMTKIALEEHVTRPEDANLPSLTSRPQLRERMIDIHGRMLAEMDAAGIDLCVLSINLNGSVQAMTSTRQAIETARIRNDFLAAQVARNPQRFQAFATLPLQDTDAAAAELTRCVKELGFKGAQIDGFTQIDAEDSVYYTDLPRFWDLWATAADLDVPIYLHPRDPLESWSKIYGGHPWLLNSRWAFTPETATHALRLMASGVFDKYPKLTIILGHLGETLPASLWRIDHRVSRMPPVGIPAKKPLSEYFRDNFYVTTSGNFYTPTLIGAISFMGTDRVLFSVDHPFEYMSEAVEWFDGLDVLTPADKLKIARGNSQKLLKLAE